MHKKDSPSNYSSNTIDEERTFSLIDLLVIVRKRWKWGLAAGLLAVALLILVVSTRERIYMATTSLAVELDTANVLDIREVVDTRLSHVNMLNTTMNTHVERLQTLKIARLVEESLTEDQKAQVLDPYVAAGAAASDESLPSLAKMVRKFMLEVERSEDDDSQVILVNIRHPSPVVAQFLADAYAQAYIQYKSTLLSDSTNSAVFFLQKQVEGMREDLNEQENALQRYRMEHNLVSVEQDSGVVGARLRRLNDAVSDARLELLNLETRQKQIEGAKGEIEKLVEVPFVGERADVREAYAQLNELLRERQVLDETYLSKHPRIIENEASLRSVKDALDRLLKQAREQSRRGYEAAQDGLEDLQERLMEAEKEVLAAESAMVDYLRMERELVRQREIFDRLVTRYRETSIQQQMNLVNISILDDASLPSQPENLSPVQLGAAGLFIFGLCLVAVPLAVELFDQRLASFRDIEVGAGVTLLGDIRFFEKKSTEAFLRGVAEKDADLVEPFRTIYSSMRLNLESKDGKGAFVVTSTVPDEGKTMVVANLAATIARHSRRVLVVDCDLRRPSQHLTIGKDNDHGLVPWFENGAALDEDAALLNDPDLGIVSSNSSFFVLRAGSASQHATEILGDDRTIRLFERLCREFDVVLFDTPPVGVFPDATLVAQSAYKTLFVASQFKVSRSKFKHAVGLMERSEAPVLGVVFNAVKDVSAAIGYGRDARSHYALGYEKDATKYKAYYQQPATNIG